MVNRTFRWDFGGTLGLARHAYFGTTDFTAKYELWLDQKVRFGIKVGQKRVNGTEQANERMRE